MSEGSPLGKLGHVKKKGEYMVCGGLMTNHFSAKTKYQLRNTMLLFSTLSP